MPNASVGYQVGWADPHGRVQQIPVTSVSVPYMSAPTGVIPILANSPAGTEVDLPLLGILTAATFLLVENTSGQELNMAWGGNWAPHLPPGGMFMFSFPTAPSSGQITSWRFFTTMETTVRTGINFWALGA